MILVSIVLGCISIAFFYLVIKYIRLRDNEIEVNNVEYIIITSIYIFLIYIFFSIYGFSIEFTFKYLVLLYLVITAFIDFKTQYVYCFLNRVMGGIAVVYIIYLINSNVLAIEEMEGIFIAIGIAIVFSLFKVWGEGDSEIFIVISPFIAIYGIEYIIMNFILAMALSGAFNLIALTAKKVKITYQIAFAPYIAISSLLILIT